MIISIDINEVQKSLETCISSDDRCYIDFETMTYHRPIEAEDEFIKRLEQYLKEVTSK